MRADVILVREHPADLVGAVGKARDIRAQGAGKVIGIRHRDIAFAGHEAFQLVRIAALRIAGEVADHALGPVTRGVLAQVGDQCGGEVLGVDVGGGPDADHALVFRLGEVLVGRRRIRHIVLVVEQDAGTLREGEPLVFIVLEIAGDTRFKHGAVDGLEQAQLFGAGDADRVNGDENVCRRIFALGFHPRDQLIGVAFDPVDGDARRLGEVRVEPFVGIVVPRRIEVEFFGGARGGGAGQYGTQYGGSDGHGESPDGIVY